MGDRRNIREKGTLTPVEAKSTATFSEDFVKRLEWFQTLGIKRVMPGAILYKGGRQQNACGISLLNLIHVKDIRQTLASPLE